MKGIYEVPVAGRGFPLFSEGHTGCKMLEGLLEFTWLNKNKGKWILIATKG
jgi:hypothetical protein